MQGSKSREDLPHFDKFECLTCRAVIIEAKPANGDDKQR